MRSDKILKMWESRRKLNVEIIREVIHETN